MTNKPVNKYPPYKIANKTWSSAPTKEALGAGYGDTLSIMYLDQDISIHLDSPQNDGIDVNKLIYPQMVVIRGIPFSEVYITSSASAGTIKTMVTKELKDVSGGGGSSKL